MNNITPVVKQLLIINIIFFIGSQIMGERAYQLFSLYYIENPHFKPWQFVTHMFMHGGITHIMFNMLALYSFGSILEHFWGAKRFLFFYFSCGLGAALIHTGANYYYFHHGLDILTTHGFKVNDITSILLEGKMDTRWQNLLGGQEQLIQFVQSYLSTAVGASEAIYGLLIAFAFMFPNAELSLMFIPIPLKAKYFVPLFLFLYDGFFGLFGRSVIGMSDGVAHWAHLGGALIGFIIMMQWRNKKHNFNRWD